MLRDINLQVKKSEFVAIMGKSGSGKSTLLYNICGMDRPTSGSIIFDNQSITDLDEEELSDFRLNNMGFIFQQSYLLKNLTMGDNIMLPGIKANIYSKEDIKRKAKSLMERTGIEAVYSHETNKVSGGQLQRVAICRALINQPEILFADEPTGALNTSTTEEVMNILNEINDEGTTIILVTHDKNVALRATRIIFICDGVISDQLELGQYTSDTPNKIRREKELTAWLEKLAF